MKIFVFIPPDLKGFSLSLTSGYSSLVWSMFFVIFWKFFFFRSKPHQVLIIKSFTVDLLMMFWRTCWFCSQTVNIWNVIKQLKTWIMASFLVCGVLSFFVWPIIQVLTEMLHAGDVSGRRLMLTFAPPPCAKNKPVPTVAHLCAWSGTTVDSTGTWQQTPEGLQVFFQKNVTSADICLLVFVELLCRWCCAGQGTQRDWDRLQETGDELNRSDCSVFSIAVTLWNSSGGCPYLVDSPFWSHSVRVASTWGQISFDSNQLWTVFKTLTLSPCRWICSGNA